MNKGFSRVKNYNTYRLLKKSQVYGITSIDAQTTCNYTKIQAASRKLRKLYNWGLLKRKLLSTKTGGIKYKYMITKEGERYIKWYEKE